jgi:hypothetical protein
MNELPRNSVQNLHAILRGAIHVIAISISIACSVADAAESRVTAQELIDGGARRLSAVEAKALLGPGVDVETVAGVSGNVRRWTNEPDGRFIASSRGPLGSQTTGKGSWRLTDDGQYCVEIIWKTVDEQWCRVVYEYASGTYLAPENLARNADKSFGIVKVSGHGVTQQAESGRQVRSTALELPSSLPAVTASGSVSARTVLTDRVYLTKPEMERLLGGKSFVFKDVATGSIVRWELRDGGRMFANNQTTRYNVSGSWEIKDDGGLCIRFSDGNSGCAYYFFVGEKLQRTRALGPSEPVSAFIEHID